MSYQGDWTEDSIHYFTFNTRKTDGTPYALAGTPSLAVYKDDGTTQSTAGLTLTADFDSVTGLNMVKVDTSADAFYAVGHDYEVVIAAGTVNSVSVVGATVGTFSIENKNGNLTSVAGTTQTAGDLAALILAVPAATGVPIFYYPTAATRATGDNDGGAFTDLAAEDGTYFATGEVNSGAFLDVTITCATADTTNHPAAVYAPGYYNGDGAHRIDVYRWDYELSAWEAVKAYSMLPRTSEFGYRCGLYPRNVSVTGEVKLRFLHAGSASGNPSHALNLDMIELEFSPVDSETPTALAQIFTLLQDVDNEVDGLVTSVDALPTLAEIEAADILLDIEAYCLGAGSGGGTSTLTYTRQDAKTLTVSNVDANGNRDRAVRSA